MSTTDNMTAKIVPSLGALPPLNLEELENSPPRILTPPGDNPTQILIQKIIQDIDRKLSDN
jgi:hypothetical protein